MKRKDGNIRGAGLLKINMQLLPCMHASFLPDYPFLLLSFLYHLFAASCTLQEVKSMLFKILELWRACPFSAFRCS